MALLMGFCLLKSSVGRKSTILLEDQNIAFGTALVIIIMRPLYKFYYFTIEGYDVFIIIEFISRIDLLIEKEIHWLSKYVLIYLLLALFSITTVEVQIFHSCHVPQSYLITFIYSQKITKYHS